MRGCEAVVVELPGFVGGKLDASASLSVQRHLQACAGCQAELRGIERLEELLAVSLPSVTPSPGFASSFANRLAQEMADEEAEQSYSPRSLVSWLVQPWLLPVGAAAVLALLIYNFAGSPGTSIDTSAAPSGGIAAAPKQAQPDTKLAKPEQPKAAEPKALAAVPPEDLKARPELFVDYAVIRDLDMLDPDQAG